ncbi:hypothetical protein BC936DRAFT_148346 [Jimgerdemannia flammicorona]|uniref:KNTC1 third ARM-repeats domain-containing protein n=1 Tax=Jimgerdemannia flammicorona TaxID=994334 RepID=A0A433D375_9FUNG|nr:hypothetical protein BC936DRAFT_148346 [Jimgerdemannia flammicorona]
MMAVDSASTSRTTSQDADRVMMDKYAASLFEDYYYETGLVMDTEQAMGSIGTFILECAPQRPPDEPTHIFPVPRLVLLLLSLPKPEHTHATAKSKFKSAVNNPSIQYSARVLGDYLRQNRTFQTAIRVFQRSQEHSLRTVKDRSAEIDVHHYHDVLQVCIQKVLSPRCIDQALALGYMISLPMEKAFNSFKAGMSTVGSDYNRLVKFAGIGMGCAVLWKQRTFLVDCQLLAANGRWWHQLKLLDIPFDEARFRSSKDGDYQRKLVPLLLTKTSFDIITVLEFGRAYRIEDDYIGLEYIRRLLLTDTVDSYQSRIVGVIDDVINREKLLALLTDLCVPRISPYDYESMSFDSHSYIIAPTRSFI